MARLRERVWAAEAPTVFPEFFDRVGSGGSRLNAAWRATLLEGGRNGPPLITARGFGERVGSLEEDSPRGRLLKVLAHVERLLDRGCGGGASAASASRGSSSREDLADCWEVRSDSPLSSMR